MDTLTAMLSFRRVVDCGSFSAAAALTGQTHTALSRQVKNLERSLGSQLLHRTTRRLQLTEAGQLFYSHCVQILEQMDSVTLQLSEHQSGPSGTLRLGVGTAFGELELGQWLPGFIERYPALHIELNCTDRFIDLLQDDVDVCLRITRQLPDSSLVARQLTQSDVILVAAPSYLLRHSTPASPDALHEHALLVYTQTAQPNHLQLTGPQGQQRTLQLSTRLSANSPMALRTAAIAGLGIASFDRFIVQDALLDGRLVQVLPDWQQLPRILYALYPHSRYPAPKVRAFIDYAKAYYLTPRWPSIGA